MVPGRVTVKAGSVAGHRAQHRSELPEGSHQRAAGCPAADVPEATKRCRKYWTSPYSSHYRPYIPLGDVQWGHLMTHEIMKAWHSLGAPDDCMMTV